MFSSRRSTPSCDGNGPHRGYCSVTLYLCVHGVLRSPLLLSQPLPQDHRTELLPASLQMSRERRLGAWLDFFLTGVTETAKPGLSTRPPGSWTCSKEDRERITSDSAEPVQPCVVHDCFENKPPFLTSGQLVERTGLTAPTVNAALADSGGVSASSRSYGVGKRGRVFSLPPLPEILNEGYGSRWETKLK